MSLCRVLLGVLVSACWLLCVAQNRNVTAGSNTTSKHAADSTGTSKNTTLHRKQGEFGEDNLIIQRALYVLIGFIMIGLLYFLIRNVRLMKPPQKKKYGLLSNYDDSVEAEDSEEDDTLYEARSLRR